MNWTTFWPALIGTTIPGLFVALLMLYLTGRVNQSIERLKSEFQRDTIKFSQLHERRLEASIAIYDAFCVYLDFLRRSLYVKNDGVRMDPMHDFHRTIERQLVYLDSSMASNVAKYQGELLQFWNWAVTSLSEQGESVRDEIRHRLDYEVPAYLPRLRADIDKVLDPFPSK